MATYISTIKFTEQGVKSISETTKRAAAFKASAKKIGVKVRDQFWTLGQFDGILIFDAPDDMAATTLMYQLASLDNVQTATMRAFSAGEMDEILGNLSGNNKKK